MVCLRALLIHDSLKRQLREVPVEGTELNGTPYNVQISKSSIGKIISSYEPTPERLAVINNIDDIVKNANYVDSRANSKTVPGKQNVVRYDYFETPIKLDGKDYTVAFNVEVRPDVNKYKTYQVIDEMTLEPASTRTSNLLGVDSNKPGSLSILNVQKNAQNVNVDKLATDVKSFANRTELKKPSTVAEAKEPIPTLTAKPQKEGKPFRDALDSRLTKDGEVERSVAMNTRVGKVEGIPKEVQQQFMDSPFESLVS